MPLSARRALRRKTHASVVGLPRRGLATLVDAIIPTAGVAAMLETDTLKLDFLSPRPGIFPIDYTLQLLYEAPHLLLYLPMTWMLIWTAVSLACLGTVRRTLGKKVAGLVIRQADGAIASGGRMMLRTLAGWLVPASLGLAYLWVFVSPQRRGWHDSLSGTFVVSARAPARPRPMQPRSRSGRGD